MSLLAAAEGLPKINRRKAILGDIAVTIDSHQRPRSKPADRTIRYDFVREAGGWKIDEIKGAVDGDVWSLRAILTDFLKY